MFESRYVCPRYSPKHITQTTNPSGTVLGTRGSYNICAGTLARCQRSNVLGRFRCCILSLGAERLMQQHLCATLV